MHKQKCYNNYQVSKATKIFTANALNFNQVFGNLINGLVHKLKLKNVKVSYAHQSCIYLSINTVKIVMLRNIIII